jgi:uncharacterized protein YllA (UPF0747 family)
VNGRRLTTEQLMAHAESLSPNTLLRPVQDFMPTVAYVGRPAEIAYLAQSAVIYEEVLGRQPVARRGWVHRARRPAPSCSSGTG